MGGHAQSGVVSIAKNLLQRRMCCVDLYRDVAFAERRASCRPARPVEGATSSENGGAHGD